MPMSPIDITEYSSYETRNQGRLHRLRLILITTHSRFLAAAASLFTAETRDVSPITSPGNSRVGTVEPKTPISEPPSRTISNRSDSATVAADPADEEATSGGAPPSRGLGPLQHTYGQNQHDPTIHDRESPHVDLIPTQGITHLPFPQPGLHGGRPRLPRIMTDPPLKSRNSDNSGTAFFTPGASGHSQPFDSAVKIRVLYSGSGSDSRVTGVHQLVGNSTSSLPPSLSDAGPSERTPEVKTSITLEREPGPEHKSKLPRRDKGNNIESIKTMFPRPKGKRAVPKWDGGDGRGDTTSGGERKEKGKERDDRSRLSTGYVSVPSEVEDHSQALTPVSPTRLGTGYTTQDAASILIQRFNHSLIKQLLTKLGVGESSKPPRSSLPSNRLLPQAEKNEIAAPIPTTPAVPTHTPMVDPSQDRERTLRVFPSLGSLRSGFSRMRNGGKRK